MHSWPTHMSESATGKHASDSATGAHTRPSQPRTHVRVSHWHTCPSKPRQHTHVQFQHTHTHVQLSHGHTYPSQPRAHISESVRGVTARSSRCVAYIRVTAPHQYASVRAADHRYPSHRCRRPCRRRPGHWAPFCHPARLRAGRVRWIAYMSGPSESLIRVTHLVNRRWLGWARVATRT